MFFLSVTSENVKYDKMTNDIVEKAKMFFFRRVSQRCEKNKC